MSKDKWFNLYAGRFYSPYLMSIVTEATVVEFPKIFPESSITKGGNYWTSKSNWYFYEDGEFGKTVADLSAKAVADPDFLFNLFKVAFDKAVGLRGLSEKYKGSNLVSVSTEELVDYFHQFSKAYSDMYTYATVASLMGYREDNPLYAKSNEILKEKTGDVPEKFADYLIKLTKPPKMLKTDWQEVAVLEVAEKAQGRGLTGLGEIKQNLREEIEALKSGFKWLSFDFCNETSWDEVYYVGLVADKLKVDVEKEIGALKNYDDIAEKDFEASCEELSLTEEERRVFDLVRYLGYYKWTREHAFQEALYNFKFVQDEIGRRCGLTSLESKYILANEIEDVLANPENFKKHLKKRRRHMLVISDREKGTVVYEGDEAKEKHSGMEFMKEEVKKIDTDEIEGTPAFVGQVTGVVRVVNTPEDNEKMEEGNILVSIATNPDLVPAMKKAAAIVTNEGGITCHAAIVSRELKIPCVVGTKIATQVLKDGDTVEVDADNGIVRKLK